MRIQEIRQALNGRTISYYDGWNGDSRHFVIINVKSDHGKTFTVIGNGQWQRAYLDANGMNQLLANGHHSEDGEIDHCSFSRSWRLL